METIKLNDEIYNYLHILTKSEYAKNQYKGIDIKTGDRFSFLPGYGTTLFYEYAHYLVIDEKKQKEHFYIWRNHEIIGECDIPKETAEKANKRTNAIFYFGKKYN